LVSLLLCIGFLFPQTLISSERSVSGHFEDISDQTTIYLGNEKIEGVKKKIFRKNNSNFISFGVENKSGWVSFSLNNETTAIKQAVVDIPAAYYLNEVLLYLPNGEVIQRGDHFRLSDGDLPSYGHTFLISLDPGESKFYLRINGDDHVSLSIHYYPDVREYLESMNAKTTYMTFFIGLVIALLLYSSFLLYAFREAKYFYYILYNLSNLYGHAYKSGILQNYFGYPYIWMNDLWAPLMMADVACGFAFIVSFIKPVFERYALLNVVAKYYIYVVWAAVPCYLFGYAFGSTVTLIIASGAIFVASIGLIMSLFDRKVEYWLFSMGWVAIVTTAFWFILVYAGIAKPTFYSNNLFFAAMGIEALLGALALGFQVYEVKNQKVFGFQQMKRLVFPHQLDLITNGVEIQKTMPVGTGMAFVIALDIEKSSKIDHSNRQVFLENVMEKSRSKMLENYEADSKSSNAYIIKGVGDGFLCSVGFPFDPPLGFHAADHAVGLAFKFIEIFNKEVALLDYVEPIYCSIGISHGPVEGYFSTGQVIQYD
jgi:hypothetical protein